MKKEKNKFDVYELLILLGLIAILSIVLYPCLYISKFSFMQADDLGIVDTVWQDSHSIVKTFCYEFDKLVKNYRAWQGCYFSDFVYFELNGFLTNARYSWTTFIAIGSMVLGDIILGKIVIKDILKTDMVKSLLLSIPLAILHIMIPYSAVEAFYWQCSAFVYTPMYALFVIVAATLIRNILDEHCKTRKFLIESLLGSFMVAGMNYTISLPYFSVLIIFILACLIKKRKRIEMSITFVWFVIWFLVNVLSPGARIRQGVAGNSGVSAFEAIFRSFIEAARFAKLNMVVAIFLFMIAFVPLFYRIAKRTEFKFCVPWLVSIASFCVFASSFTPCLYALGMSGPYRVMNVYRYSFYIILFINELYWVGFFTKRFRINISLGKWSPIFNIVFSGISCLAIFASAYYLTFGKQITAISAFESIRYGYAQAYYEQYEDRLVQFNDPQIKDCVFEPYEYKPYVLFFQDIDKNPEDWKNKVYAKYYGKDSVRLSE